MQIFHLQEEQEEAGKRGGATNCNMLRPKRDCIVQRRGDKVNLMLLTAFCMLPDFPQASTEYWNLKHTDSISRLLIV